MSNNSPEKLVKAIHRRTRRKYSAEEKIRIVLQGLRGEDSIAELCRREGLNQNIYYRWSKEFLEAGKQRLSGNTQREATSGEVVELRQENNQLKLNISPDKEDPGLELMRAESYAEDMRLLYVAITRAKNLCTIFWGAFPRFETSALSWLLQLESENDSGIRAAAEKIRDDSDGIIRLLEEDTGGPDVVIAVDGTGAHAERHIVRMERARAAGFVRNPPPTAVDFARFY